jgi:hypothetical protein
MYPWACPTASLASRSRRPFRSMAARTCLAARDAIPKSMRRSLLCALGAVACIVVPSAMAGSAPAGATARCRDGTYSFSQHRSGTCSDHGGVAVWLSGGSPAPGGSSPGTPGAAAPPLVGSTVLLEPRTQTGGCRRGQEPDRRCSPGAYYSGLTAAVICSSTFRTATIRDVPESEKFAVEREYGMTARGYGRTIEIDHIVALELGGSNDIANLFPEPGSGLDNYHVKDRLENRAHDAVCAGQLSLHTAQTAMAADWEALYRRLFGVTPTS